MRAEELITKDSIPEANRYYSKAFEYKKYPFERDLVNAINCLIDNKIVTDSIKLVRYLVLLQEIENDSISKIINEDSRKSSFLLFKKIAGYENYCKAIERNFHKRDDSLRKTLESILNDDQKVRNIAHKQYGNNFYQSPYRQKIITQDSIDLYKIVALYEKNKISEYTVGKEGLFAIWVVVLHNFAWCRNFFIDTLKSEVIKGNFDAISFAELASRLADNNCPNVKGYDYGLNYGQIIGDYYIITKKPDPAISTQIQKNRNEIFLTDSYLECHRRTAWTFVNHKNYFSLGFAKQIWSSSNKEAETVINNCKRKNIEIEYYKR